MCGVFGIRSVDRDVARLSYFALFALQQLAFERVAIRANLPAIPPMAETVAELRQDFAISTILKAM